MRLNREEKILISIGVFAALVLLSFFRFYGLKQEQSNVTVVSTVSNITKRTVEMHLPAVDNKGRGVTSKLSVEVIPGEGRTLVNVNGLLFWVDTQQSIQTARDVAQKITGIDLSKYDIIYSIQSNASLVEGPSAGAAITIATIAAVEGKPLNSSVMITGTINPDGTIGSVGGIIPKAKAAKSVGVETFLVPYGQATQVNYIPKEKCEKVGAFTFCTTTYEEEKENVGKVVGINVIEVKNVSEAMKYFFGQ